MSINILKPFSSCRCPVVFITTAGGLAIVSHPERQGDSATAPLCSKLQIIPTEADRPGKDE
jgi:hypothetical protein